MRVDLLTKNISYSFGQVLKIPCLVLLVLGLSSTMFAQEKSAGFVWYKLIDVLAISDVDKEHFFDQFKIPAGMEPQDIQKIFSESESLNKKLNEINQTYLKDASPEWRFVIALWLCDHAKTAYFISAQNNGKLSPVDQRIQKALMSAWNIVDGYADSYPYAEAHTIKNGSKIMPFIQSICRSPNDILVLMLFPQHYRLTIQYCRDGSMKESLAWNAWDCLLSDPLADSGVPLKIKTPLPLGYVLPEALKADLFFQSPKTEQAIDFYIRSDGPSFASDLWALLRDIGSVQDDESKVSVMRALGSIPAAKRKVFMEQAPKLLKVVGELNNNANKTFVINCLKDLLLQNPLLTLGQSDEVCNAFVKQSEELVEGLSMQDETCRANSVGVLRHVPFVVGSSFVDESTQMVKENNIQDDRDKIDFVRSAQAVGISTADAFLPKIRALRLGLKGIINETNMTDEESKCIILTALKDMLIKSTAQEASDIVRRYHDAVVGLVSRLQLVRDEDKATTANCVATVPCAYWGEWSSSVGDFLEKKMLRPGPQSEVDLRLSALKLLAPNPYSSLSVSDTKSFLLSLKYLFQDLEIDDDVHKLNLLQAMLVNPKDFISRMRCLTDSGPTLLRALGVTNNTPIKAELMMALYGSDIPTSRLGNFMLLASQWCEERFAEPQSIVKSIKSVLVDARGKEITAMQAMIQEVSSRRDSRTSAYKPTSTFFRY